MVVALGSMQPFSALLLASALLACADDVPRYSRYYGDVSDNEPPAVAFALERVEVVEAGTAPIYVDVSDPDVDDDYAGVLDVTIESSLGGALAAATAAGLVFYDTNSTALRFRGPQALVRAALTPLAYAAPAVAGVSAEDAITVTVDDLGYTGVDGTARRASASLPVTVLGVNGAPDVRFGADVVAVAAASVALDVSVADDDADDGALRATLAASSGTLAWAAGGAGPALALEATLEDINEALASLTYAPAPGFRGVATLSVAVDDLGGAGAGGAKQTTRVLALRVTPVNAAPAVAAAPSVAVVAGRSSGALGASVVDADARDVLRVTASARRGAVRIPAATAPRTRP